MRIIGTLILGASLIGLSGCAEQPGKKKEEKTQPVDDKQADVNKVDDGKSDDKKADDKKE
jgi:hypothetical protein